MVLLAACAATALPDRDQSPGADQGDPVIRVALVPSSPTATISATGAWRVYAADGRALLYRPSARDSWRFDPVGGSVRGASRSGLSMSPRSAGVVLRPVDLSALLLFNGKRYRGEIVIAPAGDALLVINRLGLESYLRGVVPLEIGRRVQGELAAVKAQGQGRIAGLRPQRPVVALPRQGAQPGRREEAESLKRGRLVPVFAPKIGHRAPTQTSSPPSGLSW